MTRDAQRSRVYDAEQQVRTMFDRADQRGLRTIEIHGSTVTLPVERRFASLDSSRLVPRDSGQRALNILSLARSWATVAADVPRAVAFRISIEGAQPAEFRFYSSKAAAALRPRMRITYLPRTQTAIP